MSPEYKGPVDIKDVLWAGGIEPRILEVLPALMTRRPKFLRNYGIPQDLEEVLRGIRRGKAHQAFRGIPPESYMRWLGSKGGSQLKTFRMSKRGYSTLKKTSIDPR